MNIFVGNLSSEATETQLQELFAAYGEVKSVKIITDNYTKRPRGFAFVEMAEKESGMQAIEKLNNTSLNQQAMSISEARPKNSDSGNNGYNRRY